MTIHRINLPWVSPPLTLNDRPANHRAHAREVRAVRSDAYWLAVSHRLPKNVTHVAVQLHWTPGTRRRRDPINLTPTQKAIVDGLVDYGLVPDDTPDYVTDRMPIIHPVDPAAQVCLWLEITTEDTP